jgi:3-methyladenine DNA glycosylase AlkC
LISTEDFGLKTFFYLPYSSLIKRAVDEAFEEGLQACAELTQRSTAEFAIRPYWNADPEATLRQVDSWVADPNPHVRRLVSEGARSRLPWGVGLPMIKQNPEMVLPLLEKLKDDPVRYVTRSVANHLGDIAKDHPDTMISVCERWLEESQSLSSMQCKERRWTIRHACRYLDKKGHHEAQKLRLKAK